MQFLDLEFAERAFRTLMALLCQAIYPVMSFLYELFNNVSQINILSTEDVQPIYQRVTMILTIVMIFYVTFQFVKYIVQPEGLTDKEKGAGKIVYKMIIVVILIAFVPKIFEIAYKLQDAIISKNVISKVILGPQAVKDESDLGSSFSASVFNMFYYANDENKGKDCYDGATCQQIVMTNVSMLKDDNSLSSLNIGLNETDKSDIALINFDGLLAVIVGGFIVYILLLYCIDVGVRWVQLLYLQLIAPIPILGYLTPKKDGIFQKWTKQCITTYLDLFLRVAIINIILLLCDTLLKAKLDGDLIPEGATGLMSTLIYVVLIMGVMLFAHKAPKMLSELFPKGGAASGNFGLSAKDRFGTPMKVGGRFGGAIAGTAIGAVAGAATGLAQGWRRRNSLNKDGVKKGTMAGVWGATKGAVGGLAGGAVRGLASGSKKGNVVKNSLAGAQKQMQVNQRFGNREESGYGFMDQMGDRARGAFSMKSRVEAQEAKKAPIKRHDDALKKVADTRSKIEDRALSKLKESGGKGGAMAKEYDRQQQRLKDLQENNAVRSREFKAGRFTDDKKAQAAYDASVSLAKSSINKSNYIDPTTGTFDKNGYEQAVAAAVSKVNASDYSVAYKTEQEAQNAYKAAVKSKTDAVDRNLYATEDDYNAALQAAASTVNADIYIKGYATQEDADKALAEEINKQKAIISKAKDAAVAEYVATSGDGAITSMLATLETEISEYNVTASAEVRDSNGNIIKPTKQIQPIDSATIISDFQTFSDYVKSGEIKQAQDRNTQETIRIDAEIERIKRQTSGSGINDGKK